MKRVQLRRRGWVLLGTVASETEPDVEYEIKRRPDDGHVGCACMAYAFSKGVKGCKHVDAHEGRGRVIATTHPGTSPRPTSTQIAVRGETFTVRRAISFGEIQL